MRNLAVLTVIVHNDFDNLLVIEDERVGEFTVHSCVCRVFASAHH